MSLYIGLMSGTSTDGMDAAIVEFGDTQPKLLAACGCAYSDQERSELRQAALADSLPLDAIMQLDRMIAVRSVEAIQQVLDQASLSAADIAAIGSHGHTLRHRSAPAGYSWQIGDPSWIAEHAGITCVADFRRRDIAASGEGAPLMPAFHQAVLSTDQPGMVLNLGGIGNLTVLKQPAALGFDTGPGNALMDDYCQRHLGRPCDHNGDLARQGQINSRLLNAWLRDPYFQQPAPKSTGREHFNLNRFTPDDALSHSDMLATFAELTAASVGLAIEQYGHSSGKLLVCGGGVHNNDLMQRIQARLPRHTVDSTADVGIDPDWMEAMGFAWLAYQTLQKRPGNLPAVTGARGARILGGIFLAS